MLKIGEFSRLSQVTVKTLHHYDEIGLLKPAQVDKYSNHRYYSVDQLPQIHRIIALKELGLSLEQIALMLSDRLDTDQIRGMLRRKQVEIQQHVANEQARLAQVEFRLRMIEVEDEMPDLEVVVKKLDPFRALTLRGQYATAEEYEQTGSAVMPLIQAAGVQPVGPLMEIHYGEEFKLADMDAELVGPVGDDWSKDVPVGDYGTFVVREVAGLDSAATLMHEGSLDQLPEKLTLVRRWAVANGYRLCDELRVIHHRGPMHYLDTNNLIEIQHKIEAL